MDDDGAHITDLQEIWKKFNDYYSKIGENIARQIVPSNISLVEVALSAHNTTYS